MANATLSTTEPPTEATSSAVSEDDFDYCSSPSLDSDEEDMLMAHMYYKHVDATTLLPSSSGPPGSQSHDAQVKVAKSGVNESLEILEEPEAALQCQPRPDAPISLTATKTTAAQPDQPGISPDAVPQSDNEHSPSPGKPAMERSVTESETPLQPLALPKRIMQTLILTENGALDPAATAAASPQPTSDDHDYSYLDDEEQVGNRYFIEEQNTPDRFGRRRTLEIVCFTCGSEDHRASACPVSQDVCFNCKERGHVSRDCNRPKLRGDRCGQCGSPYHHRSECPLIWRQYVYVDRVDKSLIEQFPLRRPVGAYCYQCAGRGHWGDDCLETGRNRLAYREFSAFNAHIETMPDFHPDADQVNAEIRRARPRRSQQTPPSAKRHYRPSHLADTPPSSSSRYRPPGKRHRPDYDASSPAPYEREYGRSSRHSKNSRPSPREDRHSRSSHPGLQYRTQDDRYYFPRGGHHDNDRSKDGGNSHASRSSRQQRPRSSRHHGMTISGASHSKRRSGRSSSRAHGSRQ